jgi:hypothetical protein
VPSFAAFGTDSPSTSFGQFCAGVSSKGLVRSTSATSGSTVGADAVVLTSGPGRTASAESSEVARPQL